MVIRAQEKRYLALRELSPSPPSQVGREQGLRLLLQDCDDGRLYLGLRYQKEEADPHAIGFLAKTLKIQGFTQFVDYFFFQDYLFLLLEYQDLPSLQERLHTEILPLSQRLSLMRSLLELLLMQEIPAFFLAESLDVPRILVHGNGDIFLRYHLPPLGQVEEDYKHKIFQKLGQVMAALFPQELKLQTLPDLERLCYQLNQGQYQGDFHQELSQIYRDYLLVFHTYYPVEEDQLEPQSKPFRLWEQIKVLWKRAMAFCKWGIFLLLLWYLAASIYQAFHQHQYHRNFNDMGTFSVEELVPGPEADPSG